MDERVWEKTAQFLKELRCEDTGRLSQLQLPEYQAVHACAWTALLMLKLEKS